MEKSKKRAPSALTLEATSVGTENNDIKNSFSRNSTDVKSELTASIPFHDLEDFDGRGSKRLYLS